MELPQASQAIIINKEEGSENFGKVLGVSRKDNHEDMGLVGGKRESYDLSPEDCAIRETKEETGLDIFNLQLIETSVYRGMQQFTYTADYTGTILTNEPHRVAWVTPKDLINGTFGDFNEYILKVLKLV